MTPPQPPARSGSCGRGCALAVLAWLAGIATALVAWPVAAVVEETTRGTELLWETCEREDPTATAPDGGHGVTDGICVRHERVDRLLGDDVDQIVFHTWQDGTLHPRSTLRGWPFGTGEEEPVVDFGTDAITVTAPDGVTATYPRAELAVS